MNRGAVAAVVAALTLGFDAYGLQFQETFSTRARLNAGTAIWNQELGKVHPSLKAINYNGAAELVIDVGDGSDGAFEPATYSNFGTVAAFGGGVKITLNTTLHPKLQVTHFQLAQNDVLEAIGANPLIIYSLSTVNVQGEIWCHGDPGNPSIGGVGGTGGIGRCGGGSGGKGGDAGSPGLNGGDGLAGVVTGGRGGDYQVASYVGGGGGGSWSLTNPTDGINHSASGGEAGLFSPDGEFINLKSSAGGGGGSGSLTVGGGGGGGAGGLVVIHTVGDFNLGDPGQAYGFIFANGGNGGDADLSTADGGPGGGGGGGSVQVFAGGTLNLFNNSGAGGSQANFGAGGTNFSGDFGGDGGLGRSWFTAVNFGGGGVYFPPEETISPGDVNFETAMEFVESKSIDILNASATLTAAALLPSSAEYSLLMAGSNDNFASDTTGWQSSLSALDGKRFLKFRVVINNSDPLNPSMVDTASFDYDWGMQDNFKFRTGGCARVDSPNPPRGTGLLFLLPLIILGLLKIKTYRSLRRR
jgi:hypothetical protein